MRVRWMALLLAICLLPAAGFAQAEEKQGTGLPGPVNSEEIALRLLESVFATEDTQERITLLLRAAEAAPDSVEVQVSCSQLLFYIDENDEYIEACEAMLRTALRKAKGEEQVYVLQSLSEQLIYQGRAKEAAVLLKEGIRQLPANEQLKTTLATVLYYSGESQQAIDTLTELAEDSPRNLEARRLRAAILLDEGHWDEALTAYQQIESEWPEYLDGLYGQYLTYIASGQFELGVRAVDLLLGNGAEDALWLERARIRLWNQYMPEKAMQEAEALLRKTPAWIDAAAVKLVALIMLEEYGEARTVADQIAESDLNHGELLHAIIDMNEGKWTAAEEKLTDLLERTPENYTAWKNLANVKLEGYDDVDGATEAMAKAFAITEGDGDTDLFLQLGHIYRRQGNLLEAARAYTAADMATYDDPAPLYYLVMVCIDAGRHEDVQSVIEEMERRYPGWYETMLANVLAQDALGRPDAALEAYTTFKEKFVFPASSMQQLEGMLMAETGDSAGVEQIKTLLEAGTADVHDWDAYAYVLLQMDDIEGAEQALAEAEKAFPGETKDNARELRDMRVSMETTRGEILLAQGDTEGSLKAFERAAAIGWPAHTLALNPLYAPLREAEGFDAFMASQPTIEKDWDLSVKPQIPK